MNGSRRQIPSRRILINFREITVCRIRSDSLMVIRSRTMPIGWPAEIRGLFKRYMVGRFPAKPKLDRVEVLDEARGQGYTTRNVRLVFVQRSVRVRLTISNRAKNEC